MSISDRCGSSQAVRKTRGTSAGISAMSWIEPSASLIASRTSSVHRPAALQLAHQVAVDLQELARQRLALEQVRHLRLDALVAAGDRGDRRRRRDRDQQRVAQPVLAAIRSRSAAQRSGRVGVTPHRSNCSSPRGGPGLGEAGCGAVRLGELARRPPARGSRSPRRSGSTARAPRRSRTAGRSLKNTSCRPITPRPTGRQRGLRRGGLRRRVEVDVDDPVEERDGGAHGVAPACSKSKSPSRRRWPAPG